MGREVDAASRVAVAIADRLALAPAPDMTDRTEVRLVDRVAATPGRSSPGLGSHAARCYCASVRRPPDPRYPQSIERAPHRICHAVVPGDRTTLCGLNVDALFVWPGLPFGECPHLTYCRLCQRVLAKDGSDQSGLRR